MITPGIIITIIICVTVVALGYLLFKFDTEDQKMRFEHEENMRHMELEIEQLRQEKDV